MGRFVPQTAVAKVVRLAFSADGSLLAGGTTEGEVVIWEACRGRKLMSLSPHRGPVTALAFSPSGRRLASAGFISVSVADDTIVEDLDAVEIGIAAGTVAPLPKPPKLRWVPAARNLAYRGEDEVWMALAPKSGFGTFEGRWRRGRDGFAVDLTEASQAAIAMHPGGIQVVHDWDAAGVDIRRGTVRLARWPLEEYPWDATLSADGGTLAVFTTSKLMAGRLEDGPPHTFAAVRGRAYSLSPDGRRLAYVEDSGNRDEPAHLVIADVRSGEILHRLAPSGGHVAALAFAPDGETLALASETEVEVRSITDGRRRDTPAAAPATLAGAALTPDNRALILAGGQAGKPLLLRVELADGRVTRLDSGLAGPVIAFALGGTLAVVAAEGGVEIWDVEHGHRLCTATGFVGRACSAAVAPEGTRALVVVRDCGDSGCLLFEPVKGPSPSHRSAGGDAVDAAFLHDGGIVFGYRTARQELEADPWNPSVSRALGAQVQIAALASSGRWDGARAVRYHTASQVDRLAAVAGTSWVVGIEHMFDHTTRSVIAWNRDSGTTIPCGTGDSPAASGPTALAVSPDGRLLAEAVASRPVRLILSPAPGAEPNSSLVLDVGERPLSSLAFGADGRFLVGCTDDGTAILWDVETGRQTTAVHVSDGEAKIGPATPTGEPYQQ
ncbi:MAG: hypothetical protein H7841_01770 [Magnetospirillum sp. WYHS-4]